VAVLAVALVAGAFGAGPAGVGVSAAGAATLHVTSSNWAGYAARRTGVAFRRVSGSWTVPAVDCTSGGPSYSANWIGLGGYATTSQALEQLGTESDCSATGTATYSAWFEVVPAAATTAKLTIHPGDVIAASTTVASGNRVTLTIADTTNGTKATKTIQAKTVDLSSAEWIVEAPSLCSGSTASSVCRQTALANFTSTGFSAARATTTAGHAGSVLDPAWNAIGITLSPQTGRRGPGMPGGGWLPGRQQGVVAAVLGAATPGSLSADGATFAVNYASGAAS
jgi:hypothetical protein